MTHMGWIHGYVAYKFIKGSPKYWTFNVSLSAYLPGRPAYFIHQKHLPLLASHYFVIGKNRACLVGNLGCHLLIWHCNSSTAMILRTWTLAPDVCVLFADTYVSATCIPVNCKWLYDHEDMPVLYVATVCKLVLVRLYKCVHVCMFIRELVDSLCRDSMPSPVANQLVNVCIHRGIFSLGVYEYMHLW